MPMSLMTKLACHQALLSRPVLCHSPGHASQQLLGLPSLPQASPPTPEHPALCHTAQRSSGIVKLKCHC